MHLRRLAVVLIAAAIAGCAGQAGTGSVAVGARPDPESRLVANLYAAALRFYGTPAHVEDAPDPFALLDSGTVGVVPGFTGRLLHRFSPKATARSGAQVYRELVGALPEGIAAGDYTVSAQDKPAIAVTESVADAWGADVATLARNCAKVKPGAVAGTRPPATIGRCELPEPREFPDTATLFAAVQAGDVNAAWTTTAAYGVPAGLVVLDDGASLIRAENLVPLYRRNELSEAQVLAVNELAGVLDTAALAEMRSRVAAGENPRAVAEAWLAAHPLGR